MKLNIKCGSPLNSNRYHLFEGEETVSMCGKWMYFGDKYETDLATFGHDTDCKACSKNVKKLLSKASE